jgi:hypothetical protein
LSINNFNQSRLIFKVVTVTLLISFTAIFYSDMDWDLKWLIKFILFDFITVFIVVMLSWHTYFKRSHLRLSKKAIIIFFTLSIFIGMMSDIYVFGAYPMNSFRWRSLNFIFTIPLFFVTLIWYLHKRKTKDKNVAIPLSVLTAILCMIFTLWLYAVRNGQPTEFYGWAYLFGLAPSATAGGLFGLFLYASLDKQ